MTGKLKFDWEWSDVLNSHRCDLGDNIQLAVYAVGNNSLIVVAKHAPDWDKTYRKVISNIDIDAAKLVAEKKYFELVKSGEFEQ